MFTRCLLKILKSISDFAIKHTQSQSQQHTFSSTLDRVGLKPILSKLNFSHEAIQSFHFGISPGCGSYFRQHPNNWRRRRLGKVWRRLWPFCTHEFSLFLKFLKNRNLKGHLFLIYRIHQNAPHLILASLSTFHFPTIVDSILNVPSMDVNELNIIWIFQTEQNMNNMYDDFSGIARCIHCAPGTVWDQDIEVCNHEAAANCTIYTTQPTTPTTPTTYVINSSIYFSIFKLYEVVP